MQTNEKASEAWAEIKDEESLFKFEEIITCQLDSLYTDLDRLIDNLNINAVAPSFLIMNTLVR